MIRYESLLVTYSVVLLFIFKSDLLLFSGCCWEWIVYLDRTHFWLRQVIKLSPKVNVSLFQIKLRCCGVYNYTSWLGSVYYPSNGIPASCCLNSSDCNQEDLRNATVAPSKVYHQVRQALSSPCFLNPFLPAAPLTTASTLCPLWFRAAMSWSLPSWKLTWPLLQEWRSVSLSHR